MIETLSDAQKSVVLSTSTRLIVRACPGSGKTYTVAAKLKERIKSWDLLHSGIATLSFTNVAWQEIGNCMQSDVNKYVAYPHFLGTLDSFINKNIFLPFGHYLMKCGKRPMLVGEPHGVWTSQSYIRRFLIKRRMI